MKNIILLTSLLLASCCQNPASSNETPANKISGVWIEHDTSIARSYYHITFEFDSIKSSCIVTENGTRTNAQVSNTGDTSLVVTWQDAPVIYTYNLAASHDSLTGYALEDWGSRGRDVWFCSFTR